MCLTVRSLSDHWGSCRINDVKQHSRVIYAKLKPFPALSEDWKRAVMVLKGAMTGAGAVLPQPVAKSPAFVSSSPDHT